MCHHNAYPPRSLVIEIGVALMEDINQISILIGEREIADPSDRYDGHDREKERERERVRHFSINTTAASHMTHSPGVASS